MQNDSSFGRVVIGMLPQADHPPCLCRLYPIYCALLSESSTIDIVLFYYIVSVSFSLRYHAKISTNVRSYLIDREEVNRYEKFPILRPQNYVPYSDEAFLQG